MWKLLVMMCYLLSFATIEIKGQDENASENLKERPTETLLFQIGNIETADGDSLNERFDYLFADLRRTILEKGLDPLELPADDDHFEATLFNDTMEGYVFVGDGKLQGLSTIHRSGNMSLTTKPLHREVILTGAAGLTDLKVFYSSKFELGRFFKHHFGFEIDISYVSLAFEVDVTLLPEDITMNNCSIAELNTPHLHLNGMGLFDSHILNFLGNALLYLLEPVLTNAISVEVCNLLEQAINENSVI